MDLTQNTTPHPMKVPLRATRSLQLVMAILLLCRQRSSISRLPIPRRERRDEILIIVGWPQRVVSVYESTSQEHILFEGRLTEIPAGVGKHYTHHIYNNPHGRATSSYMGGATLELVSLRLSKSERSGHTPPARRSSLCSVPTVRDTTSSDSDSDSTCPTGRD